jgi:hypothetical protein
MLDLAPYCRWSADRRRTHRVLKWLVLSTTERTLRRVFPDAYFDKCQVAAACHHTLLARLGIRSRVEYGSASWKALVRKPDGIAVFFQSGFWTPKPGFPWPHLWVRTEYGELVDLVCAFHPEVIRTQHPGHTYLDRIPPIWADGDTLRRLATVTYEVRGDSERILLGDEVAELAVATALKTFDEVVADSRGEPAESAPDRYALLDSEEALKRLQSTHAWIRHNLE